MPVLAPVIRTTVDIGALLEKQSDFGTGRYQSPIMRA
jgi:hypothetical protein